MHVQINDLSTGSLVIDAMRLVRFDSQPVADGLLNLSLEGNPLDGHSLDVVMPLVESLADVVSFDANPNAPTLDPITSVFTPVDTPYVIDLQSTFGDADGDTVYFAVESDTPEVFVTMNGSVLTATPDPAFSFVGTARITVTAHDRHDGGRATVQRFDVHVGTGGIHGTVWVDLDGDQEIGEVETGRVEGWTIFNDDNDNGELDEGEPFALTDANGQYALNYPVGASYRLVLVQQPGWDGDAGRGGTLGTGVSSLLTGVDFGVFQHVDAGLTRLVDEGQLVSLNAVVNDFDPGDGSNFSYLWEVSADNGQVVSNGASSSFDFAPNDNGVYLVTLTVTDLDAGNQEYVDTVEIVVRNVAPIVDLGPDGTLFEGDSLFLPVSVSDASGDTLQYVWEVLGSEGQWVFIGSGPIFEFNPVVDIVQTIRLTVTDDDGGVGSDTVTRTWINGPPINVDAGADQTVDEGTQVSLTGSFFDPGTLDTHTFLWHVVASNGESIADGTASNFDFTPTNNGTYTVTFTVTDNDGAMASDEVVITVNNVGPQAVDAGPDLLVDEGDTVTLGVTFSDPGATDTHAIAWTVERNSQPYATGSGTSFAFVPTDEGLYVVTVVVTDSDGDLDFDVVNVNVDNVAPSANAGGPYAISEGGSLTLLATGVDAGAEDVLQFSWDVNGDNVFGDAVGQSPTLTWNQLNLLGIANGPATFNVKVRVSDADGGTTDSAGTPLTLNNVAPQNLQIALDQPLGPLQEGTQISLSGTFADPGAGETHTYLWEVLSTNGQSVANQGGTVSIAGQVPAFNFTPNDNGVYTVRLTVGDGNQTTSRLLALGVGNVLPQNLQVAAGGPVGVGQPLAVSGDFSDPGSDTWHATLVVRDATTQLTLLRLPLILSGQAFSTSLVRGQQGDIELILEVNDGSGTVSSSPLSVSIGQAIPGDYDHSGTVDEGDFQFWRAHFGDSSGIGLQADGNGNNIVDAADYTVWRDIYTDTLGGGGSGGGASSGSTSAAVAESPAVSTTDPPEDALTSAVLPETSAAVESVSIRGPSLGTRRPARGRRHLGRTCCGEFRLCRKVLAAVAQTS